MALSEAPVDLPGMQPSPGQPFGVYVHVPFCITRCGYCDFNTYTPAELGGVNPDAWLLALGTELELAAARLDAPTVSTVFVGGGTPSLLGGERLARLLDMVREHFVLAPDAEVTTEANPESTWPEFFAAIRAAGYTRVSLGMQSVAPRVLATLDRVHSPGRASAAAREAMDEGFDHVSLDLIEEGTALARRVRRGELAAPDDDVLAHRYELVDERLAAAGLTWYEVSNWSRPGGECRHNLGYWDGGQWWGAGPGAHGYVGTTRWWNVKHPNTYAEMLASARLPVGGFEQLDTDDLHTEDVLLKTRLRQGLPLDRLGGAERERAKAVVADGLLVSDGNILVLTPRGRLLADAVVRTLLG
jgi:coproporphyrinogen III oxidase-like Fe-S oxidoreductase